MNNFYLDKISYKTSSWNGGKTSQIYIYPNDSNLEDRNFLFRVSSATVDTEESNFSDFTGFNRILTILKGEIDITHKYNNNMLKIHLAPYKKDYFSGSIETKSYGKCIDFNVIYKNGAKADLVFITNEKIKLDNREINIVYALEDLEILSNFNDEEKVIRINKGDGYVFEFCSGEIKIIPKVSEKPCAFNIILKP